MPTLLLLFTFILISASVFSQDNVLKSDRWSEWKTDTTLTSAGTMNVTLKRMKITSKNQCVITEEVIFFHDHCNHVIRKIKLRSDCKRNIGEGNIIRERNYKSKCEKQ